MTIPTAGEKALLRTQPHQTRLSLSIYQPKEIMRAQVNDAAAAKGMQEITFDNATGDDMLIRPGQTLLVGTTPGGRDKGSIYVYSYGGGKVKVGENSHINWQDDDYFTIVDFFQIWPLIPSYEIVDGNVVVYKMYELPYDDNNEQNGTWICMGPHHAGYLTTGCHSVYYTSAGTTNMGGEDLIYDWAFEGGTPSGSSVANPGWVNYSTAGHYSTKLSVTGTTTGASDAAIRHISIYDRPGEGPNVPIMSWGLDSLAGSRDEGGYRARLWVEEDISTIQDGALVVIFADDWYGSTQQSIGGNAENRQQTVFVGYILGDTIEYDYQTSRVSFEAGSSTVVMKECECYAISLEDSDDPDADALDFNKGGSPWFYFVNLNCMSGLYHYLKWHSNVNYCTDIRFLASALPIKNFDTDRSSLYDACNSFMQNTLLGAVVADRQGRIYMETDVSATSNAAIVLNTSMFVDNMDWIGTPEITERHNNEIGYLEAGGVLYDPTTGTNTALLACAPGEFPAYRGGTLKITGLALTDQTTLNQTVGNLYAYKNSRYPRVALDIAGNYRNFDIAPQELIKLTMEATDTRRGITWTQKPFAIRSMDWTYDSRAGLFLPRMEVAEVTSGFQGDSIVIPLIPETVTPTGTYDPYNYPPIIIPSAITMPTYQPIPLPTWLGGWRQFIYEIPDAFTAPDAGGLRAYNRFGTQFVLLEVHCSVSAAVAGSAIIIDVNVNGVSVFAPDDRPQIAVGETVGYSRTFANAMFAYDSYFTVDVDQGSGSDLAVVVLVGG